MAKDPNRSSSASDLLKTALATDPDCASRLVGWESGMVVIDVRRGA